MTDEKIISQSAQNVSQHSQTASKDPQENIQIPAEVRGYLEDILLASNMTPANDIMKEVMLQQLFSRLDKYIALRLVELLQPEDAEVFIKMNEEKKTKEEIETFLQSHIPDVQQQFTNILLDFQDAYMQEITEKGTNPETSVETSKADTEKLVPPVLTPSVPTPQSVSPVTPTSQVPSVVTKPSKMKN